MGNLVIFSIILTIAGFLARKLVNDILKKIDELINKVDKLVQAQAIVNTEIRSLERRVDIIEKKTETTIKEFKQIEIKVASCKNYQK